MSKLLLSIDDLVLVADDEELMREVVSIMIEDNGGKALPAIDGQDAVERFRLNSTKIKYIVLDFSMPRLTGYQAYLEIIKINPKVGVIIVSGLNITPELDILRSEGKIIFISKPFYEAELLKALLKLKSFRS